MECEQFHLFIWIYNCCDLETPLRSLLDGTLKGDFPANGPGYFY